MSIIQTKRIYYVNSANRVNGTASNFFYTLQIPLNENYDTVCILDASIPRSYYIIQTNYNKFTLSEGSTSATISCPIGNYTAQDYAKVMQTTLNSSSPNHWNYSVAFSKNIGKYLFTVTGNNAQPSFIFQTDMTEQLGFEEKSTNVFANNSLISTKVVNMNPESTLFLRSDMIGTKNGDNILQEIFTSEAVNYGNIRWQCPDVEAYSKKLVSNTSNCYNYYLTDENGTPIDTNGQNIVFTLLMYKKDKINDIIRERIKIINQS